MTRDLTAKEVAALINRHKNRANRDKWEGRVIAGVMAAGFPRPERNYRFAKEAMGRLWELDVAWPERKIAFEIEGGIYLPGGGRHNRPAGYEADCEKHNALVMLGWFTFRLTPAMIERGEHHRLLREAWALRHPTEGAPS